jgi:hypothetical protein
VATFTAGTEPVTGSRHRRRISQLLRQPDDDAPGAAEIAEQEDVLERDDLADQFGAVGVQATDGVLDVVDDEHDAMQAQRVRRWIRLTAEQYGRLILHQLKFAVAIRCPHHRDVHPETVEPDDTLCPLSLDGRPAPSRVRHRTR